MTNIKNLFTEHYSFVFLFLFTLWLIFLKILSFFLSHNHIDKKDNFKQWENWATGGNCALVLLSFALLFLYVYWGVGELSFIILVLYFGVVALSYEDIMGVNRPAHWVGAQSSYLLRYWWLSIVPLVATLGLYFYRLSYVHRYSFKYLYLTHLSLLCTLINVIVIVGIALIALINLINKSRQAKIKYG